jgi:DNA-binding NtrC family response regulator
MVILGLETSAREIAQLLAAPIVRKSLPTGSASGVAPQPQIVQYRSGSSERAIAADSGVPAAKSPKERMGNLKDAARIAAQQVERDLILDSLRRMRWNRKETAKLLGVSYKTLLAKIRENGLDDEYPDAAAG